MPTTALLSMIPGTGSNVGKSHVVAGLVPRRSAPAVLLFAPFKPQNHVEQRRPPSPTMAERLAAPRPCSAIAATAPESVHIPPHFC